MVEKDLLLMVKTKKVYYRSVCLFRQFRSWEKFLSRAALREIIPASSAMFYKYKITPHNKTEGHVFAAIDR